MYKTYKIRIYPTKEQINQIHFNIGACRFVWNYMIELQTNRYKAKEKYLTAFDMAYLLKPLKQLEEYQWLKNAPAESLVWTCRELDRAYKLFFHKKTGCPKFRSKKRSKQIYPLGNYFYFLDNTVRLLKLGPVKYKSDQSFPIGREQAKNFYESKLVCENNKYYITFRMMCENQVPSQNNIKMGIDLGVKEFAYVAFGENKMIFHNINKTAKMRMLDAKMKRAMRSIARKYVAAKDENGKYIKSKNICREIDKLRRIGYRQRCIRKNYMHQVSHKIVSMLPSCVVMEDLNVAKMMKNKNIARGIRDQSFSKFIHQMEYKCELNGIKFIQADRFYPSSKTCSGCGYIKRDLKLSDRVFVCPECGLQIDRDYNAAINLMRYEA